MVEVIDGGLGKVLTFSHEHVKRKRRDCFHQKFVIDTVHGTVECEACGDTVSAFHALVAVAKEESRFHNSIDALRRERDELSQYKPWLKAVRELERIWRGGTMLPQCPHCRRGVTSKGLASTGTINAEYEKACLERADVK